MIFVLSKVLEAVSRPSLILILLMVVCAVAAALGRRGWRTTGVLVAMMLAAIAILPVGGWLLRPLEARFPVQREMPAHVDGIIVLGGVIDPELSRVRPLPSLNEAADRITAFVTLARHFPEAKLVFTGGTSALDGAGAHEADFARPLVEQLGIDPSRVLLERDARTTYENAVLSKRLVGPQPDQIWLLVTSAAHMPRAIGVFREAGWPVIAWPVAYKSGGDIIGNPARELETLDTAVHEYLGLLAYRLLGYTDALFPAP